MNFYVVSLTFVLILIKLNVIINAQSEFIATECKSKLLSPRSDVAVAFDGVDSIYIFGGVFYTADEELLIYDEVHKFNVTSDEIEVVARLPRTAHGGRAHFRPNTGDILYLRADGTYLWSFNVRTGNTTSLSEWTGSSAGVGLTYLPDAVMAFGGLDDTTQIFTLDLETSSQSSSGTLPLKSELCVSLHSPTQQKTFMFAGELGNRSPILMEFDHAANATTVLSWELPSFRHGDGSPVLVSTTDSAEIFMYILGAVINNGNDGDHVQRVNLISGIAEALSISGVPKELTATAAAYVPSLHRIYFFGGYDLSNEDKDAIWYIQLQ